MNRLFVNTLIIFIIRYYENNEKSKLECKTQLHIRKQKINDSSQVFKVTNTSSLYFLKHNQICGHDPQNHTLYPQNYTLYPPTH